VLIARTLYDHENRVEVINVEPEMDEFGWRVAGGHLMDCYKAHDPAYAGRATVPLLVDSSTAMIVSNESAALMRLLGTVMADNRPPLFPPEHAITCEAWNFRIQHEVNARIYDHGLAASSADKIAKTSALIEALSNLDQHLANRDFLITDERPLEPDWRLWVTLARYDLAYRPLLLSDEAPSLARFPNLHRFFEHLLAVPEIAATYRPNEIVTHYTARVRDLRRAASNI
jgi:putative glutathione S-transferase